MCKRILHSHQWNFRTLAERTHGYSNSDLVALCREAAMVPIRELSRKDIKNLTDAQIRHITMRDFEVAMKAIKPSTNEKILQKLRKYAETAGQCDWEEVASSSSFFSIYCRSLLALSVFFELLICDAHLENVNRSRGSELRMHLRDLFVIWVAEEIWEPVFRIGTQVMWNFWKIRNCYPSCSIFVLKWLFTWVHNGDILRSCD